MHYENGRTNAARKLIRKPQALQELLEEHQKEINQLTTNIEDVRKLIADFDAGIDQNPWGTYKVLYNVDQDEVNAPYLFFYLLIFFEVSRKLFRPLFQIFWKSQINYQM